LNDALSSAAEAVAVEPKQEALAFARRDEKAPSEVPPVKVIANSSEETAPSAEKLLQMQREILRRELAEAQTEAVVVKILSLPKAEVKKLLKQLIAEGVLEKISKPVRYRTVKKEECLL
jgi:hypothetical protein